MKRRIRVPFVLAAVLVAVSLAASSFSSVFAIDGKYDQKFYSGNGILFYNPDDSGSGGTCSATSTDSGFGNNDYTGAPILNDAQLKAISENQSVYEQAAKQADIPWQMVAVIHLRETGLKKVNPTNGQGIYQDAAKLNGPYPAGPVDDAEFLRQTIWAANFLKNKATKPELLAKGDSGQIKDAFYGYNGRADVYAAQAKALGFTNDYEGSPYVMNMADAQRDPNVNKTTWGQIKRDGGPIEYPANKDDGAYVDYSAIAGLSSTGCGNQSEADIPATGTAREKIVQIAQQQYAAWVKGGVDYTMYTNGIKTWWCAYFATWVYTKAGVPLAKSLLGSVSGNLVPAAQKQGLYHAAGSDYKPQAGDMVIYDGHVNILINPNTFETIGGDEGTVSTTPPGPGANNIKDRKDGYWKSQAIGFISVPGDN